MWLLGVVVRRYVHRFLHIITYPYTSLVLAFFAAAGYFFKKTFVLVYVIFCNIANVAQNTFEIVQKSRSHEYGDIIISRRNVRRLRAPANPETFMWRYRVTFQESCS